MKAVKTQTQQPVPVIYLYAITGGRKTYVSTTTVRESDKRLVPHFHTDKAKAMHFKNQEEVDTFLRRMVNAENRKFLTQNDVVCPEELAAPNHTPTAKYLM